MSQTPLPILNHIKEGYLPLINYHMNEANVFSFTKVLAKIVPQVLRKMYLVNNSIKQEDIAQIFEAISETSGL